MNRFNQIMVLEDDEIASFLIRKSILQIQGVVDCLTFENGKPALDWLLQNQNQKELLPSLILVDLNMPVMDGWEFLSIVKENEVLSKIPAIVLTSSVNPADKDLAGNFPNIFRFLSKPLTRQLLEKILEELD